MTGSTSANYEDLKQAVRQALERQGALQKIKAHLRADIFHSLDEDQEAKPTVSQENLLINELIRDYLEFNHYSHALSVFLAETNQPREKMHRDALLSRLQLEEPSRPTDVSVETENGKNHSSESESKQHSTAPLPLLYGLALSTANGNTSSSSSKML